MANDISETIRKYELSANVAYERALAAETRGNLSAHRKHLASAHRFRKLADQFKLLRDGKK